MLVPGVGMAWLVSFCIGSQRRVDLPSVLAVAIGMVIGVSLMVH